MEAIDGVAMAKAAGGAEENLFVVQYRANEGSQYSGIMNAAGALELARQGYSYQNILRYYYDYSSYTGGNAIVFRAHA